MKGIKWEDPKEDPIELLKKAILDIEDSFNTYPEDFTKYTNSIMDNFINPKSSYKGEFTPETMLFDDNLQDFSNQVSLIVGLENNGKLTQIEAYRRIKLLWKTLKRSKKNLIED